jgi:uncharacterized protein YlzI (FlbEa/FlbD family)
MLVILQGLDGQRIDLNPESIVSIRKPSTDTTLTKDVECVITTVDGKVITVTETCKEVEDKVMMVGGKEEN